MTNYDDWKTESPDDEAAREAAQLRKLLGQKLTAAEAEYSRYE